MNQDRVVAIYARVSSEGQVKDGTINSQIAALKERVKADETLLAEEQHYIDLGVSGGLLQRPQLERLRDNAAQGLIDRLYIHSPDRLSRKYAHQVLLLEELAGCGVEVIFLNHAVGSSPEEELLLQMQGMIAEYERAKIMERNRRGKLHKARSGCINVLSGAPYGYRYISKQQDGTPAHYVIELQEAAVVRDIFHWIGVERLSIGEVTRRLAQANIKTKTGKDRWDRSVIWGMLQNPAYKGMAAFGKTRTVDHLPRIRPQKHSSETPKKPYSTQRVKPEHWIEIPVPPLISESLFSAAREQLEENRKQARQRRRGAAYLLQGLTVCGHCHYAYYGKRVSKKAIKGKTAYAYYRCIGTDGYRFGGQRICDNKQIRTSELDQVVWTQVVQLLKHPERLKKEYQRRLKLLEQDEKNRYDTDALQKQINSLERGKSRLIDSYTEGFIDREDFEPKIIYLKERLKQFQDQLETCQQDQVSQHELFLVVEHLSDFAGNVSEKLDQLDFHRKREIIRGLVKRIEIYKNEVVVVFRIEPEGDVGSNKSTSGTDKTGEIMQDCKRSYYNLLYRFWRFSGKSSGLFIRLKLLIIHGLLCSRSGTN